MQDYIQITRDNIDKLKIGHHIKYKNRGVIKDAGILINILNPDNPLYTELLLKSFSYWTIPLLRFNIYMKINTIESNNEIKEKSYRELYINEINERKQEYNKEINNQLDNINKNKNKYKIIFHENNI